MGVLAIRAVVFGNYVRAPFFFEISLWFKEMGNDA